MNQPPYSGMSAGDFARLIANATAAGMTQALMAQRAIEDQRANNLALSQEVAVVRDALGGNPLSGSQFSNSVDVIPQNATVDTVTKQSLLRCRNMHPELGMATVHIATTWGPVSPGGAFVQVINERLDAVVTWKTAAGGGQATVDITQGAVFTVGASDALDVDCLLTRHVEGLELQGVQPARVEAVVHWGTSVVPIPIYGTLESQPITGGGAPVVDLLWQIPPQSRTVCFVTDLPAEMANFEARFREIQSITGAIRYATTAPGIATRTPIVRGARWVNMHYTGAVLPTVTPVFELYL